MAQACRRVLVLAVCIASLCGGAARAAPYTQAGLAPQFWSEWAARPLILASGCPDDGAPCPGYEPRQYAPEPIHARHWEPEPPPYVREERPVARVNPDCVEERYAARSHFVREARVPRNPDDVYEEPCGIKCWYKRLRRGYCGRGCDYYRFRMNEFREGKLGRDEVRVVCR